MRLGITAAALVLVSLLVPSQARAQYSGQQASEAPGNYVTAHYNFNVGGDLFKDRTPAHASGVGASLTVFGRRLISAEAAFDYNYSFFGASDKYGTNYLLAGTLSGVAGPWLKAGPGRIRPYLALGGGYARASVTNYRKVDWSAPAKNLGLFEGGGGILWLVNDSIGVRADVRYRYALGSKESGGGWGIYDHMTYMRTSAGLTIAF
jgi:hypothetical protein